MQQVCLLNHCIPVFISSKFKYLFYTFCLKWLIMKCFVKSPVMNSCFSYCEIHLFLFKSEAIRRQLVITAISVNLYTQVLTHGWSKFLMKSFTFSQWLQILLKRMSKEKVQLLIKQIAINLGLFLFSI